MIYTIEKKLYVSSLTQNFVYNTKLGLITKKDKLAKNFYIFL